MNIEAMIITSLAGTSTILGFFSIFLKREDSIIPKALGFSAGVMLFVSFIDLFPTSLSYFQKTFLPGFHFLFCILFLLFGILFSLLLNEKIKKREGDTLYHIGILSMLAIILHNIPEGIITYLTTTVETKTGIFLAISIACHNIPEGICIALPIYYSTHKKRKAFEMVVLSSIAEPIGALIAYFFLQNQLNNTLLGILLSLVAGIMISLSLIEILPEAKTYSTKYSSFYFIVGIVLMFLFHLLF